MIQVVNNSRIPIKSWASNLEDSAQAQAENLANTPYAYHHIALMADCHQGYGMPIGGVLAANGVVVPNAVGVDIGCGVCAVQTNLTHLDQKDIDKIFGGSSTNQGGIRAAIPVGFNKHSKKQEEYRMPDTNDEWNTPIVNNNYEAARKQIGTLGGGNHFIELQKGDDGFIWVMIHSGSRRLGFEVAKHYNKIAVELNAYWHSSVPKKWELAFLPEDSAEYSLYLAEMTYCVEYAKANRWHMLNAVLDVLFGVVGGSLRNASIDIAHNYAIMEHHYGKNVMVHRKGATRAREGEFGIIPGSQGTASYIVRGLGNKESFESCSHGAGRRMGRKQACRELDFDAEKRRLDALGVVHSIRSQKDLDEAPGAYKDITEVMSNQEDLIEIITELKPLGVIKG